MVAAIFVSVSAFPSFLQRCLESTETTMGWDCKRGRDRVSELQSCLKEDSRVKSKETVGNSWTVLKVILGHKYHHNH